MKYGNYQSLIPLLLGLEEFFSDTIKRNREDSQTETKLSELRVKYDTFLDLRKDPEGYVEYYGGNKGIPYLPMFLKKKDYLASAYDYWKGRRMTLPGLKCP